MGLEKCLRMPPGLSFQLFISTLLLLFSFSFSAAATDDANRRQTYIVHVHRHERATPFAGREDRENWHKSFLPTTSASAVGDSGPRLVYSYEHVISGFAAKLTPEELKAVEAKEGVICAHPDHFGRPQTTYTPQFLGLSSGGRNSLWKRSNYGQGVIIGILDTGIFPEHVSFSDAGMPPPPTRWKGRCDFNKTQCNNKIIGARVFADSGDAGEDTPVDEEGHGTHVASIAAGNFVKNAGVLGNVKGTAAGVAPRAHLAVYRVCILFCSASDMLAGMDQAIADGVDVISINVNFGSMAFYEDSIAIASLRAAEKGVFVSATAGNAGPELGSVGNDYPWVLTVGASTVDRSVRATVKLGNGAEFDGESLYQPTNFSPKKFIPLVYPGGLNTSDQDAESCNAGSLEKYNVKGKVVMCSGELATAETKSEVVKQAGGAGMVFTNTRDNGYTVLADANVVPAAEVSYVYGQQIRAYVTTANNPTATIVFKGTQFGSPPSPTVASFSSRGPSANNGGVLKPDVVGPGVNILGAYPFHVGPQARQKSTSTSARKRLFNLLSGTSMAGPHLAGVAALIKAVHPDWSPAAIKSAIMTTSDTWNRDGSPIAAGEFAAVPASYFFMGAGHVNPDGANEPGLVYDIQPSDYLGYLCGGLGYTDDQLRAVARRRLNCSKIHSITAEELNYPSISLSLVGPNAGAKIVTRTVTNVGTSLVYTAEVDQPGGVQVTVSPAELRFKGVGKKASFTVELLAVTPPATKYAEGSLKWVSTDKKYVVRSPISITFK